MRSYGCPNAQPRLRRTASSAGGSIWYERGSSTHPLRSNCPCASTSSAETCSYSARRGNRFGPCTSAMIDSSMATWATSAPVMRILGAPGMRPVSLTKASTAQRVVRGPTVVSRASGHRARPFSTRRSSVAPPGDVSGPTPVAGCESDGDSGCEPGWDPDAFIIGRPAGSGRPSGPPAVGPGHSRRKPSCSRSSCSGSSWSRSSCSRSSCSQPW